MRILNYSCETPQDNLALDEAILRCVEQGESPPTLRLWESAVHFVVLGVGQRVEKEVYIERCARDGVPVLRRCSAGGCVLQGPGCMNFSLALPYDYDDSLKSLHHSYQFVLERIARALAGDASEACFSGISDLAMANKKVSGNAQKRCQRSFLHHGTLLYAFDISLVQRYVKEPEEQPDYRRKRFHNLFMGNMGYSRDDLVERLFKAFPNGTEEDNPIECEWANMKELVAKKYACDAWNFRR